MASTTTKTMHTCGHCSCGHRPTIISRRDCNRLRFDLLRLRAASYVRVPDAGLNDG